MTLAGSPTPHLGDSTHRFLLDSDGSNLFHHLGDDVEAAVLDVVAECPDNVTTYLLCSGAGSCYWPTRVGHVDSRATGLVAAHDRGQDPLRLLLAGMKAAGKEVFITYRMNDVHNPEDTDQWNTPRIRREHPDVVVGLDEIESGKASWMSYCLDYSQDRVRHHIFELIQEQLSFYGDLIDGFQLDWMRFPRHLSGTPEQIWSKRQILSDFVDQIGQVCHQAGTMLAVRVPPSTEGCQLLGFDLQAWAARGSIDFVVPCPFLTTDWQIPVADFRELIGAMPVYAGFDFGFGQQVHFPESLRGICSSHYDGGADGIYVFNFPCWTEYLAANPFHWLQGLDSPETACTRPLCFSVNHQWHRQACDNPGQIPVTVPAAGKTSMDVNLPEAALPTRRALCLIEAGGEVKLTVNGSPAQPWRSRQASRSVERSELFVEFIRTEGRARPEDCRIFAVSPESLRPGANQFTIHNAGAQDREIQRLNLGLW